MGFIDNALNLEEGQLIFFIFTLFSFIMVVFQLTNDCVNGVHCDVISGACIYCEMVK